MFQTPTNNLILVWNQTKDYYKDYPEQESILLKRLPFKPFLNHPHPYETEIDFFHDDCIDVAIDYKKSGLNPLVLNMCDWDIAGGLVGSGASTQEEECFRRSNYYKHLRTDDFYPLESIDTIISNNVEYTRHGFRQGYVSMKEPVLLDMVAAPCITFPLVNNFSKKRKMIDEVEVHLFENKIRMLLYAGIENGNDSLVLSAWGCGAFGCPPGHVGFLFRKIIFENAGLFKKIAFAILGTNYTLFQEGFLQEGDDYAGDESEGSVNLDDRYESDSEFKGIKVEKLP